MGVSLRAYARHRGMSDSSVRKAIKTGRITQEPDGTVDPDKADAEWERNTRSNDNKSISSSTKQSSEPNPYTQARMSNEVIKAQRQHLKLQAERGELINRDQVLAQVFRLARTERDAWLTWPARIASQLAAEFKVDPQTMHQRLDDVVREHLLELAEVQLNV